MNWGKTVWVCALIACGSPSIFARASETSASYSLPSRYPLFAPGELSSIDESASSYEQAASLLVEPFANAAREDSRLGEAPPDDTRVFLRQSAVLLNPGTIEVEYGLRYTLQESGFLTQLPDASLVQEFVDVRSGLGTLTLRYGLAERWQPFATLPLGLSYFDRQNVAGDESDVRFGLGDVLVGVNHLLRDGKDKCADIIANITVGAPTGLASLGSVNPNFAPLGNGFTSITAGLTFVRTYDPIVLFANGGYTHSFAREFFGQEVQPGEAFNYGFGAGFAVNEDITLSTQFQSTLQLDFHVEGARQPITGLESSLLRHSVVRRINGQSFVELFLLHGLTDDSLRTSVGVLSTQRF